MKKILFLAVSTFMLIGCGENIVSGDTICGKMEKRLEALDVFGTGAYSDRRAEFTEATGCTSVINCSATMVIYEDVCIDDVEVR